MGGADAAAGGKPEVIARELGAEFRTIGEGAAIASESALAARFGVSRVVVREAIARLRADGFVRTERGRGHFVASAIAQFSFAPSDLESLLQVVELRAALESQAAALSARRRSAADLALMASAIERMGAAIESGDVEKGVAADGDFHRAILTATGNPYYSHFADFVTQPLLRTIRIARERSAQLPARRWQAQREHQQIYDAIRQGNPRAARAAAQLHIDNTAKRLSSALSGDPGAIPAPPDAHREDSHG